jgi:uncharacterized Tic20 family protein
MTAHEVFADLSILVALIAAFVVVLLSVSLTAAIIPLLAMIGWSSYVGQQWRLAR